MDLSLFRHAPTLRWHPHTVFEPGTGADGTLFADGDERLPLDIYSHAEIGRDIELQRIQLPISNGVGIVIADPATVADAHEAVRSWCRDQLGRDDIEFDLWEE